jgi:hypothetical protein
VAQQITRAAIALQEQRTGHAPKDVTVIRKDVRTRWLLTLILCGLAIMGPGRLDRSYGQDIAKHPLGHTTALLASEVGKIHVPSRYGGILTLNANAHLYYTDGSDLASSVAAQIYQGSLEASLVAQGYPCAYTVPPGKGGWYYFIVPGGTSGMSNNFVEAGEALTRPWNGWWWARNPSVTPTLYNPGGPFDKYDQANNVSSGGSSGTPFYQQNMDANPGWSTQGSWSWGVPTGMGGDHGGVDPTSGFTGSSVYGYNLSGGYENNMVPASLTTTAIDCSHFTGIHLQFRRWLCIEQSIYDHASVQVTNNIADANSWITVWDFSGPTLLETSWSLQDYDISAVADGKPAVYIRWVMGPTDAGWTWGGWNIDDVALTIGSTVVSVPNAPTQARSWEATNDSASGSNTAWFGHCWGWSIASILMSQPQSTIKNGISFARDDMEGLYTELADNDPYVDQSLTVWYIPPGPPTSSLGQDVDAYCDDLYRILRTSIREDRVPVQSDMRAAATPPSRITEVWNHAIYKYSASFSEAPGTNNEYLVRIDMNVWSNSDSHGPPTDDTDDRHENYIYELEFDATGQVIADSAQQNWISASHYPPHDLLRLTGTPWNAKNPEVTKARVDGLYERPAYAADINGDGLVNVVDLLFLADSWGRCRGDEGFNLGCDLNADGCVDMMDLLAFAGDWGNRRP